MKLSHSVNMGNFINQLAEDHDLIDELVANAVEGGVTRVEVVHTGETITIKNDGTSLELDQIKSQLLTAFETGPEKSFETNRGLGFIAIYRQTARAVVKTGTSKLTIVDWDDISVERIPYQAGFSIVVELTEKSRSRYSYISVHKQLQQWIYWGAIKIFYGRSAQELEPIGKKFEEPLAYSKHPQYPYANLRYSLESDFGRSVVLYKLTNVNVYRQLPIDLNPELLVPNSLIGRIVLVISHGAYLDATRRSLSNWGREQVSNLLELIDGDLQMDLLRRSTFAIRSEALDAISSYMDKLSSFGRSENWKKQVLAAFSERMKNHSQIVRELTYFDRFTLLLSHQHPDLQVSSLVKQMYRQFPQFLDDSREPLAASQFHSWVSERFSVETTTFFADTVLGFVLDRGDISHQLTVTELISESLRVVHFSNDLFSSPVVGKEKLGVILHSEADYVVNLSPYITTLGELTVEHGIMRPDVSDITSYAIGGQVKEYQVTGASVVTGVKGNTPYLLYDGGRSILDDIDPSQLDRVYRVWREAVELCIRSYKPESGRGVIPVIVFRQSGPVACMVHHFIGLSSSMLVDLFEMEGEVLRTYVLYAAVHEVAHLHCRAHSHRFFRIASDVMQAVFANGSTTDFFRR